MSYRQLKKQITTLLQTPDLAHALDAIGQLPARQAINPLFGLLCDSRETIRWRAVSALGALVAALAEIDLEAARVCMRRLMWQLNDESGGIGWGCPEAMGEAMARQKVLASQYAAILVSYAAPWGNYLEHLPLQQGLLWGLGRLGHSRPHLIQTAASLLPPFLKSADPALRGLAAWAAGPILTPDLKNLINTLREDDVTFRHYWEGQLETRTVAWAVRTAINFAGPV